MIARPPHTAAVALAPSSDASANQVQLRHLQHTVFAFHSEQDLPHNRVRTLGLTSGKPCHRYYWCGRCFHRRCIARLCPRPVSSDVPRNWRLRCNAEVGLRRCEAGNPTSTYPNQVGILDGFGVLASDVVDLGFASFS